MEGLAVCGSGGVSGRCTTMAGAHGRRRGESGGVGPYLASSSTLHLLEFGSFDLLLQLLLNYGALHPFTSAFIYFCVYLMS